MTATAATEPQPFTVIGFWDDSDTAIPVGVVKGVVDVYGGHGVSEGGPWARDVIAVHADEAEALAVKLTQEEHDARIAEIDDDEDDDDEEGGDEETGKVFEFDHNGRTYDVDFGGETYAIYDDENKHVAFFDYYGDRENHLNIEDAAIKALEALNL
jgi:hypothetical protein